MVSAAKWGYFCPIYHRPANMKLGWRVGWSLVDAFIKSFFFEDMSSYFRKLAFFNFTLPKLSAIRRRDATCFRSLSFYLLSSAFLFFFFFFLRMFCCWSSWRAITVYIKKKEAIYRGSIHLSIYTYQYGYVDICDGVQKLCHFARYATLHCYFYDIFYLLYCSALFFFRSGGVGDGGE